MKKNPFSNFQRLSVILLLAFLLPHSAFSSETDSSRIGFRFAIRPTVSVLDFGRNHFNSDLNTLLGVELPSCAVGGNFQFGMISSRRWGLGLEFGVNSTTSKQKSGTDPSSPVFLQLNTFREAVYAEYTFIDKPKFELLGQFSIGLAQSFFRYENTGNGTSGGISLSEYRQGGSFSLNQKILGSASIGVSARWKINPGFSIGAYLRWVQQIGNGYWYGGKSSPLRINDLSKSSPLPLEIGIEMIFSSRK